MNCAATAAGGRIVVSRHRVVRPHDRYADQNHVEVVGGTMVIVKVGLLQTSAGSITITAQMIGWRTNRLKRLASSAAKTPPSSSK